MLPSLQNGALGICPVFSPAGFMNHSLLRVVSNTRKHCGRLDADWQASRNLFTELGDVCLWIHHSFPLFSLFTSQTVQNFSLAFPTV